MTVNISSLQTELLKLLSNDKEIPMETVLNQSLDVDEVVNKDLKGGENIAAMTENLLTGGDLDNGASSKEIVSNILMDDKKEIKNQPADIIEQIIEKEKDVNDNMEGGEKKKQTKFNESSNDESTDESDESSDSTDSTDESDESSESTDDSNDESGTEQNKNDAPNENDEFNDEQQAKSDLDEPNDELKNSMLNLSSDYDDSDSYDDSDNENLSSSYISIINEFSTPATKKKLTGGLVNSSSSRVKVIPMFPYIIKTEPL